MLGRVIDNVTASRIDHTLVVLGAEKDRIGELLNKRPVSVCYNANYIEGMLSSVKCGIKHLPESCRAFLVFQGDQPLILPSTTDKLIDAYLESGKGIMMPVYNNRKGHPLLIDSRFIANVEQLDNNHGLRALAEKMPGEVLAIEVDDPGILRDFDTPEDYNKEINQIL